MAVQLVARERRIPPSRGLVLTRNRADKPLRLIDLLRWVRYNREVLKADKIDVLADGESYNVLGELLDSARDIGVALSLRTDASAPPRNLAALKAQGLFDVFLCPNHASLDELEPWIEACRELSLPIRLQLHPPFSEEFEPDELARRIVESGVVRVDVTFSDPFSEGAACRDGAHSESTITLMETFTARLEVRGVEASLLHVPLCVVEESSLSRTANAAQCAADHAYYISEAYELARTLYRRGPIVAGKIILMLFSRGTFKMQPMDNLLLPVLFRHNYIYLGTRIYRRLTNHLRISRSVPKELSRVDYDKDVTRSIAKVERSLGPVCGKCAYNRICDHDSLEFMSNFPGLEVRAIEGDHVVSPLHFSALQPKYYDALDRERLENERRNEDLLEEAQHILIRRPPDMSLGPYDYGVEKVRFDRMESGLKWWSLSNVEVLSTVLGTFEPPLTLSVDIGAGIADYVGFNFGRHCKIVCPMEAYRHNITLHVDAEGNYVLLRDRRPVRPVEFEGHRYVPLRLGGALQPRISIWNIDECVATQNLHIWSGKHAEDDAPPPVKYSIIIVSTRFTRRLHAVLRSLAHQEGFDLSQVEVLICYVPGLDATDDLLDGMSLTYPELRMVRSPFTEQYARSKGFMINETAKIASGEWIMLLDSDTLLPPDYFAKMDEVTEESEFIAPDGRKLLPKDITAKILMGEIAPWETWVELLEGDGEFRHREANGTPVGFCQCFRAKYLEEYPYLEEDHFEVADMRFGEKMRKEVGDEHRLSGTPVIHLDHGGSQWYGTQKHM